MQKKIMNQLMRILLGRKIQELLKDLFNYIKIEFMLSKDKIQIKDRSLAMRSLSKK